MFTLKFAFKNIISRKSSFVIILFIAVSIAILVMANAIFDETRTGIEKTFSANFTGDIMIRPKAAFPMSLFGDETPITGSLSELPELIPYADIFDFVQKSRFVKKAVPQITGQAALRIKGKNFPGYFFGVEAKDYVELMKGIKILEGEPYESGQDALMLSANVVQKIKEECGAEVKIGEQIQIASFTGTSFSLRAARLCAVYEYSVHNDLQDRIILASPAILRELLGLGTTEIDPALFTKENSGLLETVSEGSIDDLFGDDFSAEENLTEENLSEKNFANENSLKENLSEKNSSRKNFANENSAEKNSQAQTNKETIWNYIVCSVPQGVSPRKAIRNLNREFSRREWQARAFDWRAAAGMAAQYIYWMRLIFNIGLLVIIGTGFIIVNNSLVIAALDRTTETGALRAIGAGRRFVAAEYFFETLILTITAGVLGCVLGAAGNAFLSDGRVVFSNSYLIQLFGGETLHASISAQNVFWGMALSLALAVAAWIYPVKIALETSPVAAMEAVR